MHIYGVSLVSHDGLIISSRLVTIKDPVCGSNVAAVAEAARQEGILQGDEINNMKRNDEFLLTNVIRLIGERGFKVSFTSGSLSFH